MDDFAVFLRDLDDPVVLQDALGVPDGESGKTATDTLSNSPTVTNTRAISKRDDATSSDEKLCEDRPPLSAYQARLIAKRQYRARRKTELHNLRTDYRQLAARRDELVIKHGSSKPRVWRLNSGREGVMGWRGVALRQMRQRIEAEALNQQLKEQVREHQVLAECMRSVFATQISSVDARQVVSLVSMSRRPGAQFSATDLYLTPPGTCRRC